MSNNMPLSTEAQNHNQVFHTDYTFDNFVVGNSNRYAHTVALCVAKSLGQKYSPVFIYGGIGLGKTHLLHAIKHYAQNEGKKAVCTTVEQFMHDFTDHLRHQTMDIFRNKYRTCDVLLIDDIQYIAHKFHTQEELYHTFNELHLSGAQIVVTSTVALEHIDGLDERLKSRLGGGFMTDIGLLDEDTKKEIIQKKSAQYHLTLTNEVINDIVLQAGEDIRKIESALINLSLNHQK